MGLARRMCQKGLASFLLPEVDRDASITPKWPKMKIRQEQIR